MTAGRWGPYLVDGISALGVVAQEVAGEDDPGHVGSAALLPLVPQLPCHHVHQQLGAQQALAPASTQAQTRHQQHKPAREVRVPWVPRKQMPPRCPRPGHWQSSTTVTGEQESHSPAAVTPRDTWPGPRAPASHLSVSRVGAGC